MKCYRRGGFRRGEINIGQADSQDKGFFSSLYTKSALWGLVDVSTAYIFKKKEKKRKLRVTEHKRGDRECKSR